MIGRHIVDKYLGRYLASLEYYCSSCGILDLNYILRSHFHIIRAYNLRNPYNHHNSKCAKLLKGRFYAAFVVAFAN